MPESPVRNLGIPIALLFLSTMFLGCARDIMITGYLDKSRSGPPLQQGSTFAVLENTGTPNPIFDKEIKTKIEKLLAQSGYRTELPDKAQYYLNYNYNLNVGLRVGQVTMYGPPQTEIITVPDQKGGVTHSTVMVPGSPSIVSRISEEYTKQLMLKVIDTAALKRGSKDNVVWVGEAFNTDPSSDLRSLIDSLLTALFKYFGQDTGKQITVKME